MTPAQMARSTGVTGPSADEAPWLRRGPLFLSGGVAVYDGLLDGRTLAALCAEAQANYASADRQVCDVLTSDNCDWRGGIPPRQLSTSGGGAVQDEFYRSRHLRSFLSQVCGGQVRPTGSRGSYSYYVASSDYLGLHLDIVTCDVTVINVLADSSPDNGGSLAVHRGSVGLPLSVLRRSPHPAEQVVKAPPGSTIVILGGLVPHRVLPITTGQRVISALCFEAACSDGSFRIRSEYCAAQIRNDPMRRARVA